MECLQSIMQEQKKARKTLQEFSVRLDAVENYEEEDPEMHWDLDEDNNNMGQYFMERSPEMTESMDLDLDSWMKDNSESLSFKMDDDENSNEIINQYEEEKETSPSVNSKLADYVNNRFRKGIKDDTMKKLLEEKRPLRPENCENLAVVKMNTAVFKAIPAGAKKNDVKLQGISRTNIVGSIWLTQVVDEMLQLQKDIKGNQVAKKFQDSLSKCNQVLNMMAQTHYKINMFRKNAIRNVISPKYRDLCSENIPYTEELFGTDISKTVTELENQGKISLKMGQRNTYRHQNARGRGFYRGTMRPYNRFFERPYERPQTNYNDWSYNRRASKNDYRNRRGRNQRRSQRSK